MRIYAPAIATVTMLLMAWLSLSDIRAQDAVNVTIEAEHTELLVGETMTVTVYGQIDSAIEADSPLRAWKFGASPTPLISL